MVDVSDKEEIKLHIRKFLSDTFRVKSISDTANIIKEGGVHSLYFIQLLIFIEKAFKIELQEDEFDITKLTSIEEIASVIENKVSNQE